MRIVALVTLVTGIGDDRAEYAPGQLLDLPEADALEAIAGGHAKADQSIVDAVEDDGETDDAEAFDADGLRLRINHATAKQIAEHTKGVGINTARDIVAWREAHGPFADLDSLTEVGGVGETIINRNREALTVD